MTPTITSASIEAEGSVAEALRRAAGRFAQRALRALSSQEPSDSAVHEARKQLKRARTALRLLRPALTIRLYRRENGLLREVAHSLNAARDATVLTQTLDSLLRGHRALSRDPGVAHLRRILRDQLAEERRRLRRPLSELVRALEIVSPMRPRKLARLLRQAKQLTDYLGDARDLVMLEAKVKALRKPKQKGLRRLLTMCERRRTRFELKAMATGNELYRPRPRDWEGHLEEYWTRWRRTD